MEYQYRLDQGWPGILASSFINRGASGNINGNDVRRGIRLVIIVPVATQYTNGSLASPDPFSVAGAEGAGFGCGSAAVLQPERVATPTQKIRSNCSLLSSPSYELFSSCTLSRRAFLAGIKTFIN